MGLFSLTPEQLIANLIALLVGLTVHEFAHAAVADWMGDPTPRAAGRLTLNPFVSINWVGLLMFALIGFGILGTTPVSPGRMRNPRWGAIATYVAGPAANLALAMGFALLFQAALPLYFSGQMPVMVFTILDTVIIINVVLFLFNLIPLYPLDGWRIVLTLLPRPAAMWWVNNAQASYFLLLGLILLSLAPASSGIPNVLRTLIGEPAAMITGRLLGI